MDRFINHLQVHVCQSSTVADHCRTFALSDPDNASFRGECDHLRSDTCDWCAFLHSALAKVESALAVEMENLTDDEKEELSFKVTQATGNILAWKAHILRSIHPTFHTSRPSPCRTTRYTRRNISIVGPGLGHEILAKEIPREQDRLVW